ncbi:YoaK family protein [Oleiagrimonas sp. C23AA]|uniref:YoaK family protein n=1 Tax=Oleiagrimonas sp. C23AA TaxID=2719047 RepID=UPI0014215130|nr:YoaK family protein [Oleiagrimonas sp. C23AA]NII09650.1 DUF1275 domain-containing protein [Oleiagrimonas sp. C23AA]
MLACVAGSVDASTYINLGKVFPANMTGNTVLIGLALGAGHLHDLWRGLAALLGFAVGVMLAALYLRRPTPGWDRRLRHGFVVETLVLLALYLGAPLYMHEGHWAKLLAGSLAAMAMGLQAALVRHLRMGHLRTTFITGPLVEALAVPFDPAERKRGAESQWGGEYVLVFLAYAAAAAVAAWLAHTRGALAMAIPAGLMLATLVVVSVPDPGRDAQR